MTKVGAKTRLDKTSDEFKALEKTARKLGATTSFSASEAKGMNFLAMAGFDANKLLQRCQNAGSRKSRKYRPSKSGGHCIKYVQVHSKWMYRVPRLLKNLW